MTKNQLRKLLESHRLAQTEAARALEIDPRTMRRYIAGDLPVPRVVEWALLYLIEQRGSKS
jgi:hypothetical protein